MVLFNDILDTSQCFVHLVDKRFFVRNKMVVGVRLPYILQLAIELHSFFEIFKAIGIPALDRNPFPSHPVQLITLLFVPPRPKHARHSEDSLTVVLTVAPEYNSDRVALNNCGGLF